MPDDREDDDLDSTAVRRRRQTEEREPPRSPAMAHPVKEIVLPLATVLLLVGNAWWAGVGWGKVSTQLEGVLAALGGFGTRVTATEADIAELKAWRRTQEQDDRMRDERFRLFRMYTKGRIARLPYRASDDGE